jgi:hypothetical protein
MVRVFNQRKQATMQWLQDPSQSNVDKLNNATRKDRMHFKYKLLKWNNLRPTVRSKLLDTYEKTSMTKKVYRPRNNTVKDQKGDLVIYSHSILARYR